MACHRRSDSDSSDLPSVPRVERFRYDGPGILHMRHDRRSKSWTKPGVETLFLDTVAAPPFHVYLEAHEEDLDVSHTRACRDKVVYGRVVAGEGPRLNYVILLVANQTLPAHFFNFQRLFVTTKQVEWDAGCRTWLLGFPSPQCRNATSLRSLQDLAQHWVRSVAFH